MRYKSIYSVSFDADDDEAAQGIARNHHEHIRDDLRVEGADHPHMVTLEELLAIDASGSRKVLAQRASKPISD